MVVNAVGHLAEAAWHHPDLAVSYAFVIVKLCTHSSKGVTERDFALARKIEEVVQWQPGREGGVLEKKGMVEVISSLRPDGTPIDYDIRMGVWVTVEAETDYIKHCFEEYNAQTDDSGRYFTLYKRWHLIGLEVGLSVASVALRGEPTGVATGWHADVVATAKRDLKPGEVLDGEGGYTVWGKLQPAAKSVAMGGLPLGLAHDVKLIRPVAQGQSLTWADVAIDTGTHAYRIRQQMESLLTPDS